MAAFRPTRTFFLGVNYDLYPPRKVVSCFKGAVPPLNNSHGFLGIGGGCEERSREAELLSSSQATSYN